MSLSNIAVWFSQHKKATASLLTVLVTEATALLSLGVLSGPVSHDIALGLIAAAPIFAFFGVKAGPPNAPASPPVVPPVVSPVAPQVAPPVSP
jgi:hypothetical protein